MSACTYPSGQVCNQFGEPVPSTIVVQAALGDAPPVHASATTAVVAQPATPPAALAGTGADVALLGGLAGIVILVGALTVGASKWRHRRDVDEPVG